MNTFSFVNAYICCKTHNGKITGGLLYPIPTQDFPEEDFLQRWICFELLIKEMKKG